MTDEDKNLQKWLDMSRDECMQPELHDALLYMAQEHRLSVETWRGLDNFAAFIYDINPQDSRKAMERMMRGEPRPRVKMTEDDIAWAKKAAEEMVEALRKKAEPMFTQ